MLRTSRALVVSGLAALAVLTPSTAMAADGARGEANALRVSLLGETQGTGTVVATNDGTGEEKTGPVDPPVSVLTGQPFVDLGVLAQDAAANDDGTSEACSGVAGDGGSVIEIGESGCLEPGDNIALGLSDLDLAVLLETEVIDGTGDLATLLGALGAGQLTTVVDALNAGLDEVVANVGDAGLYVDADAVQAFCNADGSTAEGTTLLANADLRVAIPGVGEESLVDGFDPEPEPNTRLLTDMQEVYDLLLTELEDSLNDNLDEIADVAINTILDPVQEQVVNEALTQLQPALSALEENVVRIVLNKQETSQGGKRIDVTGLYVRVLPAAEAAEAPTPLAQAEIANVGCGPMAAAAGGTPSDDEGNPVPTTVNAGADSGSTGGAGHAGLAALLASVLALLGVGALARLTARE